jgi:hypothetical protein
MRYAALFLFVLTIAWSDIAVSHEGSSELVEELIVYGRAEQVIGVAESSSEGIIAYDDIRLPPMLRVGELAEAVPGMVATQHSGTGKANQYFLRGFNLDHGTDFAAFVDGVPINMRTHGHGQGYLDLNFIIPELVERTTYRKGPYAASSGDFSSAGSVQFEMYESLRESFFNVTAGVDDYYRALAAASGELAGGTVTGAFDYTAYDGPWVLNEDLSQTRFYASYAGSAWDLDTHFSLLGYSGTWNATDQLPLRAVQSGLVDELGFIDPFLGGRTDRYSLTGNIGNDQWEASAYVVDYDFGLYSNFTYLLDDPINGDQFEQVDDRRIYGLRVDGSLDTATKLNWGGDIRYDDIAQVGLFKTSEQERRETVREDSVDQLSASAYAELVFNPLANLRAAVGVRADYFAWDVNATRPENSGDGDDLLISPKLNIAYRFNESTEAYANYGRGFHSNDARGKTITVDPVTGDPVDSVDPLVQSNGAELGLRFERDDRFNATATAFWLELDSELLFVGDAGTTEAVGSTSRQGIELATFYQATDWLAINFAYTYTDSKFDKDEGAGRRVPGAIESSATLGLNGTWSNGLFVSARARYLGPAPLIEDNSVRAPSSLLVNIGGGYRLGDFSFRLDLFNVFDSDDYDITYYFASRLPGEPAEGVEDIHYRPLEPRSIRTSVTYHW